MRGRFGARRLVLLVLTPILAFYFYVTLSIAWGLLRDGRLASRGMALGLIALVAVSVGLIVAELRFGQQVQALSTAYDAIPGDSAEDEDAPLPLAPSGRPDRDAADAAFDRVRVRVEQQPDDWRAWYELGLAYGDARDTARGRRAMRHAISLRSGDQ
jgi:cytochrome c-type biogenesis protein CcmH/NrfG